MASGYKCLHCDYCKLDKVNKYGYCDKKGIILQKGVLDQPLEGGGFYPYQCWDKSTYVRLCSDSDSEREYIVKNFYLLTALKTILNIPSDDYVISNITNLITRMRVKEAVKSPENSNAIAYDILGQTFANNMKMHFSNIVNKHNCLEGNNKLSAEKIHYNDNINIPDEAYSLATYVYNKLEPIARKYEQATLDYNEYLKDEATNDYLDTIFNLYEEIKFTKQEEESKDLEIITYIKNKNEEEKKKNKQKILLPIGYNNKNN